MMRKMMLLGAGAVGYVLGTKAGRERYEQIQRQAQKLRSNPKVQQSVEDARSAAKEAADTAGQKAKEAADTAGQKAKEARSGSGSGSASGSGSGSGSSGTTGLRDTTTGADTTSFGRGDETR